VVIGGGLLGLEAANGLMLRGMQVTVVHIMPWLMERQLDDVAGRLLQQSLEAAWAEVRDRRADGRPAGRRQRPREGRAASRTGASCRPTWW
jgi:NAD(P)H-nitrite reductase large subunit